MRAGSTKALNVTFVLAVLATGCACPESDPPGVRLERIERGLLRDYSDWTWQRMRLADRMRHHRVPGLGIAFADRGEIAWARSYGFADSVGKRPIEAGTLFQAASVSKSVTAALVLALVERGEFGLDDDVSTLLRSWRLPTNAHTAGGGVTPRRLLSHTAGASVEWFRGYRPGDPVPTLVQVLDGSPPANSPPVTIASPPGSAHSYSGGGYCILQQAIEDATGRSFCDLARQLVLAPAGSHDSTFEHVLSPTLAARVATGHLADGRPIDGRWHVYPENAAASLWTTPSDLVTFAVALMQSLEGGPATLLSQSSVEQMLTPANAEGSYGLGLGLGDDGGDKVYFLHAGANEGFRCVLVAYPRFGQAVAIMTNGNGGGELWHELLRSVSIEYGWVD